MKPLRLASAACGAPRPVLNLTKALEDESGGESCAEDHLTPGLRVLRVLPAWRG